MALLEKLLVEIVTALIWAGIIGFCLVSLGRYFLRLQKDAISNAIQRIESVGKSGVSLGAPQFLKDAAGDQQIKPVDQNMPKESNTPQPQNDEKKKKRAIEEMCNEVPNRAVFIVQEQKVKREFEEKGLDVTGDDVVKVLIKHLAGFQILHAAERVHGLIFGSQIILLKEINQWGGVVSSKYLSEYYEKLKKEKPEYEDSEETRYFAYLFSDNLIVREGDSVHITDFGKEFLLWITYAQKTENKRF